MAPQAPAPDRRPGPARRVLESAFRVAGADGRTAARLTMAAPGPASSRRPRPGPPGRRVRSIVGLMAAVLEFNVGRGLRRRRERLGS